MDMGGPKGGGGGLATVENGVVYVGMSNSYVYALNVSDGSVRWEAETGGQVLSPPAVGGGAVYVGSTDTYVYAFKA